jgi:regulator of sirC expression with transglutaminase-like and TPR domain
MLMLCVVLAEDYGVHYDAQRRTGHADTRADDGFFADPSSVFLHGLLGPDRKGTCSSLPVLYVAVGRRLGYPLKLVTTRGHLFVRWEGQGERFNVEATARGLSRFDDDYYRHWPFEVSPAEEAAEGYLKSLTASEEFAVFLSIRGMCLRELGRSSEAEESFAAAAQLAPGCRGYSQMLGSVEAALGLQIESTRPTLKTKGKSARY